MEKYRYSQNWFLGSEIKRDLLYHIDKSQHSILEIGCFEGLSSVFFADNLLDHPSSSLTCVDPFMNIEDNDHKEFLQGGEERNFDYNISICKHSNKIQVHKITSDEFFKVNRRSYDFIYIDGCHDPEFIKRDMNNAWAALETGGIMWMDDYGGGHGGNIRRAMDAALEGKGYTLIHKGYQLALKKKGI